MSKSTCSFSFIKPNCCYCSIEILSLKGRLGFYFFSVFRHSHSIIISMSWSVLIGKKTLLRLDSWMKTALPRH